MTNADNNLLSNSSQFEIRKLIHDEKIKQQLGIFLKERKKLQDLISDFIGNDENEMTNKVMPFMADMSEKVFQHVTEMGYVIPKEVIDTWFDETYK